jgi:hypothetical protein
MIRGFHCVPIRVQGIPPATMTAMMETAQSIPLPRKSVTALMMTAMAQPMTA